MQHISASGTKLCALGADGDVLAADYGLQVDVSPPEASTGGLVAELERRDIAPGARVLAPVPLVTGAFRKLGAGLLCRDLLSVCHRF